MKQRENQKQNESMVAGLPRLSSRSDCGGDLGFSHLGYGDWIYAVIFHSTDEKKTGRWRLDVVGSGGLAGRDQLKSGKFDRSGE